MSLHGARVGHRGLRLGVLAFQDGQDLGPDATAGIAPEHVVGGLVAAVSRRHVRPGASGPYNVKYAVQCILEIDSLHPPLLWKDGFDQSDVSVVQFTDARHGGFSFASARTLASRAWFAREARPLF